MIFYDLLDRHAHQPFGATRMWWWCLEPGQRRNLNQVKLTPMIGEHQFSTAALEKHCR